MSRVCGRDFASVYDEGFALWMARVWPFLLKAARKANPAGSRWLDLCCGTRALLEFARRHGFSAVGVDRSRHQLRFARRNAPLARLVRGDVRDLALPGTFDVITCTYDSLNYLTSKRELERVLRRVLRQLGQRGLFAFDANTFEGLEDRWHRTTSLRSPRYTLVIETVFHPRNAMGTCRLTGFVKEGRRYRKFEEVHVERGYRASEIEELLERVGFSFTKLDGETLSKPRKRAPRLLYLCRGNRPRSVLRIRAG